MYITDTDMNKNMNTNGNRTNKFNFTFLSKSDRAELIRTAEIWRVEPHTVVNMVMKPFLKHVAMNDYTAVIPPRFS